MHRIDPMNGERIFVTQNWDLKKKNILGTSLEKSKTTHAAKNPIEGDIFWQKVVIQPRSYINDPFGNTS